MYFTTRASTEWLQRRRRPLASSLLVGRSGGIGGGGGKPGGGGSGCGTAWAAARRLIVGLGAMVLLALSRVLPAWDDWAVEAAGCTGAFDSCLYNPDTCGACTPPSQIQACAQPKTIHLTIDDGPFDNTPTALQILAWKQVPATFFLVGSQIAGREQIVRDIYAQGHNIASHSNTHPHLGQTTNLEPELTTPSTLIKNALSTVAPTYQVKYFRPPFGECPTKCSDALKAKSLVATYWNIDSQDWQFNMTLLAQSVDGAPAPTNANPGLIMLIHLENNFGLCALPTLIDRLRYRGYNFVTADQCWGTASTTASPVTVAPPTTNPAWPACTTTSPVQTGPVANPCLTNNGGCMSIATCTASTTSPGTAVCTCPSPMTGNGVTACTCPTGYTASGSQCVDTNECATNNGGCSSGATCTNTIGSRTCTCRPGLSGNGVTCANINECTLTLNGDCFYTSTCTDAIPTAANNWLTRTCSSCPDGYTGNAVGYSTGCVNINECTSTTTPNGGCSSLVTCTDLTPVAPDWRKFLCGSCPPGYEGDGWTCTDINECLLTPKGGCSSLPGVGCFNTPGSYFCAAPATGPGGTCPSASSCRACPVGYSGNGVTCTDIDECATGTHTCLGSARCTNEVPGFHCECRSGLRGDGIAHCDNINECVEADGQIAGGGCDPLTVCTDVTPALSNSWLTRTCSGCPTGYTGNGTHGCVDIDECVVQLNGGCSTQPLVACTNTPGSRLCAACPAGFLRSNGSDSDCPDINECATENGGCFLPDGCTNTAGSRSCAQCPTTMHGNGLTCVANVQCTSSTTGVLNGGCDLRTNCTAVTPARDNGWTAVVCSDCPSGFAGHGSTRCTDIDDCASQPCANGGRCIDAGANAYRCECTSAYEGLNCELKKPLSAAAVATIAVPAVLGGLILVGAIVFGVRRYRSGADEPQPSPPPAAGAAAAGGGGADAVATPVAGHKPPPMDKAQALRARLGSPRPATQPHIVSVTNSPVQGGMHI